VADALRDLPGGVVGGGPVVDPGAELAVTPEQVEVAADQPEQQGGEHPDVEAKVRVRVTGPTKLPPRQSVLTPLPITGR